MEKLKEFEQKLEAFCKEFKEFKEKKGPRSWKNHGDCWSTVDNLRRDQ